MVGLTDRQREMLDYMCEHFGANGVVPTIRELSAYMGIRSSNGISDHMRGLQRKGFVRFPDNAQSRSYRILRLADGTPVRARLVPVTATEAVEVVPQEPT